MLIFYIVLFHITPSFSYTAPASDLEFTPEQKMIYEAVKELDEAGINELLESIWTEVIKESEKLPESERQKFLDNFLNEVSEEAIKLEPKIKAYEDQEKIKEVEEIKPEEVKIEKPIEPSAVTPKPVEAPKAAPSKVDQAIKLIDNLLTRIESFLRKTQIIPDFNAKVQDWSKKRALQGLPEAISWSTVKKLLESLVHKLYTLKDRDPKTKSYKYIDELLRNQNLYNNLAQLNNTLTSAEPQIETPDLGESTLTEASKKATQKTLNSLIEALYRLNIPSMIDDVFASYETRAKKIKEEEIAAIKEAEKAGAKPAKITPVTVAGVAPVPPAGYKKPVGQDFGFTPPSRIPDMPYGTFGREVTEGRPSKDARPEAGAAPGAPGAPAVDRKPTEEKKPEKKEEPKVEKPKEEKKEEKPKEDEKKKPDLTEKRIESLELQLENIIDVIEEHKKLKSISRHILSDDPVDVQLATKGLPDALSKTRKAISNSKGIERSLKKLTDKDKKSYKDELESIIKQYDKTFNQIIDQINSIKSNESSISDDKYYAYLGGKKIPSTANLVNQIPNPSSVYDLKDLFEELIKLLKK